MFDGPGIQGACERYRGRRSSEICGQLERMWARKGILQHKWTNLRKRDLIEVERRNEIEMEYDIDGFRARAEDCMQL